MERAEIVCIKAHLPQVTEDPDDNLMIETAYSGRADYIVSGDKHLLVLREFKGIKMATVDEVLRALQTR